MYWTKAKHSMHSMKPESNPEFVNTRFQYKSRDLYWPDDVCLTQYRSILSGFQPMKASVTLQKRIKNHISALFTKHSVYSWISMIQNKCVS